MIDERLSTAFHEAGHATVLVALGRKVQRLSAVAHRLDGRLVAGCCYSDDNEEWKTAIRAAVEEGLLGRARTRELRPMTPAEFVAYSLAGFLAEWWVTGERRVEGAQTDIACIGRKLARAGAKRAQRAIADGIALAERTLNDRWDGVRALAWALHDRGELTDPDEIRRLANIIVIRIRRTAA